ncbi:glycosyltransferase family 4 protein [Inquilinus sp.]|uniref:glycosyltransferase family 4 protein n=1 Tax=Inquilinus sp. TaxID=1932117 RepID=UPI00378517BD
MTQVLHLGSDGRIPSGGTCHHGEVELIESPGGDDLLGALPSKAGTVTSAARDSVEQGTISGSPSGSPRRAPRPRRKLTVAVTFPVWPPRGGGQSRIFHLYRHVARHHDVEIVSVANANDLPDDREIAPGLREIRVPKSPAHRQAELALAGDVPGVSITDIAMPRLVHLSPDYGAALAASLADADLAVASHPYLFPLLRQLTERAIWYEAHNVETALKRGMLPDTPTARALLAETEEVERACCAGSDQVVVCADTDGSVFRQDFGVPAERVLEIPNGVDLGTVAYADPIARRAAQERLGLHGTPTALFMGSGHKPNVDAVEAILGVAAGCPDIRFLIMGSVCGAFSGRRLPANVGAVGEVDDDTRIAALGVVDCALNPMGAGSGTNLKMLDYFAAGVPVISTRHGARGLAVADGVHLRLSEVDGFPAALRGLQREIGGLALSQQVAAARRLAEDRYDWAAIAERYRHAIETAGT